MGYYKPINPEKLKRRQEALYEANPGLRDAFLKCVNHVVEDIRSRFNRWGKLSDKQVALVLRMTKEHEERAARWAAEEATAASWTVEGKQEVTGTVASVKEKCTQYGYSWKMVLKLDDGRKAYSTVPAALIRKLDAERAEGPQALRGSEVTVSATLRISDDSKSFAFLSRPQFVSCDRFAEVA